MRLVALALALVACSAPQLPPARRPPLRVTISPDLGPWRTNIMLGLRAAERVGRAIVVVAPEAVHDVSIVHGDDAKTDCAALAGEWAPLVREIRIWPACIAGGLQMVAISAHEALHALGGTHVCRYRGELPDAHHLHETCSPVGYGLALLNPVVPAPPESCDPYRELCTGDTPQFTPTLLDRAEMRRAMGAP